MDTNAMRRAFDAVVWLVGLVCATALAAEALAGGLATPPNTAWTNECGSCHIAYPPRLLAAPAWRTLMGGLDRHFGVDASVDKTTATDISAYLDAHAGEIGSKRVDAGALRITDANWFQRKHREVAPAVWKRASVGSPARCDACHPAAVRGDFNEHAVRVPN